MSRPRLSHILPIHRRRFLPKEQTDVYKTFVRLLGRIRPPFVVTTNVDEALEASVPMCQAVQRTDISRCIDLLQRRIPFVAGCPTHSRPLRMSGIPRPPA